MSIEYGELLLTGVAASQGVAQGKVRLVSGSEDAASFNEGDVLVTKITNPSMVIMMAKAAAIVCDVGGVASHPSIVSREMGIPCVVNVQSATITLRNGQEVIVDGTNGKVFAVRV